MPNPILIAQIVKDVAQPLLKLIKKGLDKNDTAPDKDLVSRAVELLCTLNAFHPENIPTKGTAEFFEMWLEDLLSTPDNPDPVLNAETLGQMFGRCFGAPWGTDILPKNRATIPSPQTNGDDTIKYLFEVDRDTVPDIDGVSKDDFVDLVKGAWQRWQLNVDRTKLTVRMKEGRAKPNLRISFGTLDGTGQTLGVTESMWSSDGPSQHSILIDMSEEWTPSKLMATMTHEIGHALGLEHVDDPTAIMSAVLDPDLANRDLKKVVLQEADIAALTTQRTPWV